ncbi:hypothetical protein L1049_019539 [Liquidambar formosana]|uniref:Uncharacterized protein n=1 Tax=Liquidambar formosana TaxID=63359 RepID=A0AAP0SBS5_LIQFO
MASSFPPNTHQDHDPLQQEAVEEDADWLELGLGLNTACTKAHHDGSNSVLAHASSSSSSILQAHQRSELELELGLGLGLGLELQPGLRLDDEGVRRNLGVVMPLSNYNGLWEHHSNHDDMSSLTTLITSPPWLALHDREMPVPDVSHDYCRRPQSGLWFILRSSINRYGEALPQIPKAYIRVKDENVTVFLVKKYLVRKLGLSNEAEIDVSCMGQKLLHSQTLKHVRDAVWLPRLVESLNSTTALCENPHDSSINHLMSLHYGRRCF